MQCAAFCHTHTHTHTHTGGIWPRADTWRVPKGQSAEEIKQKVDEAPAQMPQPEESCFRDQGESRGIGLPVTDLAISDFRRSGSVGTPGLTARQ